MTTKADDTGNREGRAFLPYPLLMLAGLAFAGLMVLLSWVGWIGSDDARHIDGALGWYRDFPYLPLQHGEFRHFITIPAALSFTLFGISDYSAVLPILLYFFGLIAVTLHEMYRRVGASAALLAVALLVTLSTFSVRATVAYADIAEAFFILLSLWLFLRCCERTEGRIALLLSAGILAGAAWLTRETTAALLLFYGLLFLIGFGLPRRLYWVMALGFFIPVIIDAVYFTFTAGSPIYRYTEIFQARVGFRTMTTQTGELFNDIGNVQFHPLIDPLLAVLANHEVGLIFYLVPFILLGLWRDRTMDPAARKLALLLLAFAFTWFVVTSLAVTRYHPRYFTVSAYATALAAAIWFTQSLFARSPKTCLCVAAVLLAAGTAGIYLENRNPIFGARTLSHLAAGSDVPIHSDAETYRRAHFLLLAEGAEARASSDPPGAGDLFLFNPNRVTNKSRSCAFWPAASWETIDTIKEDPKFIAVIIRGLGLTGLLHPSIERRLLRPNAPVTLYRVDKENACRD